MKGAAGAIAFYKKAFGAKEVMRMPGPKGTIGHAEIQVGDSRIMLADVISGNELSHVPARLGALR